VDYTSFSFFAVLGPNMVTTLELGLNVVLLSFSFDVSPYGTENAPKVSQPCSKFLSVLKPSYEGWFIF